MFNNRKFTARYLHSMAHTPKPYDSSPRITGMDIFTILILVIGLLAMAHYGGWF